MDMDGPTEIFFERGNPLSKNLVSLSEKLAKILQDLQDFLRGETSSLVCPMLFFCKRLSLVVNK